MRPAILVWALRWALILLLFYLVARILVSL
jgi:hypothetical protein